LVAQGRASRQGQIDYWEKDARKVKRRAAYAAKKAAKSEGTIDEGDHRKEAWDVLAQVKKDLKASFLTVKDVHKRFPLKGSQIALSNSAIEKISTASGWIDKLMKDIATG